MTNKEQFRQLINLLVSELSAHGDQFLVNRIVADRAGFPDGTELSTPVGKIIIKHTDKPVIGFEVKRAKKAA